MDKPHGFDNLLTIGGAWRGGLAKIVDILDEDVLKIIVSSDDIEIYLYRYELEKMLAMFPEKEE